MSKGGINLQDNFLNQIRKEKIPVTIHLLNGTKMTGVVKGFDNFIIFLKNETQSLVYKHSVSAIIPQKNLRSFELHEGEEGKAPASRPEGAVKGTEAKKSPEAV